jgi:hypothetical protein
MVFYNDPGFIMCLGTSEMNEYRIFLNDGTHGKWVQSTGASVSDAMNATGLITVSDDDFVLGAMLSESDGFTDGWDTYYLEDGVWKNVEEGNLVNGSPNALDLKHYWQLAKSDVAETGSIWSYGESEYTFDNLMGDPEISGEYLTFVKAATKYDIELANDETMGSVSVPSSAAMNSAIDVTVAAAAGYQLKDVTVTDASGNGVLVSKISDTTYRFIMPESNVNVSVTYTPLHIIAYYAGSGAGKDVDLGEVNIGIGQTVDVTVYEGYLFSFSINLPPRSSNGVPSWLIEDDYSYSGTVQGEDFVITMTYLSSATVKTTTMNIKVGHYDAVLPEGEVAIGDIADGVSCGEKQFLGWSTSADGISVDLSPGDKYDLTGDLILTGVWADLFTVTFDLDGGKSTSITSDDEWTNVSGSVWTKEFLGGSSLSIADPTKDVDDGYDYVFLRWEPALPDTVAESASYAAVFDQRFTVDNLVYSVADSDAKTAKVVGYEDDLVGTLEIPDSVVYDGIEYAVSAVARAAFVDCTKITSLTLGANTELHAFYRCYGLESVTVCEGVTSIGVSTFAYSDAIKHVELPSTLEEIGVNAFYKYTFYGMEGTKLARTAENLAGKTFEGSSKALRESFEAGGLKYSFQGSLSVKLTGYTEEPAGELVIPSTVEYNDIECTVATVAKDAFRGCAGITSVELGANAALHSFYRCSGLESVTICEGVTSIGTSAFAYCDALRSVATESTQIAIGTNAFYRCSGLETLELGGTTSIGTSAFSHCVSLRSVEFPSTLATIGKTAFYRCSGLEAIDMNGVVSIGAKAFAHCVGLTHVGFSSALAKIGTNAFYKLSFYNGETKLGATAEDLCGHVFEGSSKKLYMVA